MPASCLPRTLHPALTAPTRRAAPATQPPCLRPLAAWLVVAGLLNLASQVHAAGPLPEAGQVQAGSASISRQGQTLTVQQGSARLALDWQSFNIAAGHRVQFVQPSAQSVALNRVLGNEASVLQGGLQSNGQVFLLNPNGILFGAGAQVQVGGLLASTLNMDTADFMAGRLALAGSSRQAVVNQGQIEAAAGGSVALVAARISNSGQISAPQGQVLMAAGQKVRIDLGGVVPIEVEQGALQAVIDQQGAVQADGGRVYLTAKAAGDLASAAINHTGITEARSLASGERGEIWLLGDMARGTLQVSGRLDASAPQGGDGGFIETSAAKVQIAPTAHVSTLAAAGRTGTWLIDPNDYVIAASGGDISGAQLASNLALNNVSIQSTAGAGGSIGDIHVNDAVRWTSANTLTLNAFRDIHINADIAATQGTLTLLYGQGALNNATSAVNPSRVYINNGASISLSAGQHFNTRLGSDGELTHWTVVTALGHADSNDDGTLQGIDGPSRGNYVLGADIDATPTRSWNDGKGFNPLGNSDFRGRFDGLGHKIDGLYINRPDESYVGFMSLPDPSGEAFPWSAWGRPTDNPQIANLGLTNVDITGGWTSGAFAGEIRNAMVSNVYATGRLTSNSNRIGGLVGNNKYGVILNSYAHVDVTGSGGVGGLVGEFEGEAYITNSYAIGTVTSSNQHGGYNIGGLVGSMGQGVVSHSYYSTTANASTDMVDRSQHGKTTAELKAAAIANWSAAVWDTSGDTPRLKQFTVIPVYGRPVEGRSDPSAPPTALSYSLGALDWSPSYDGSSLDLGSLWTAAAIFGDGYARWTAGTDYVFQYNGNTVTGFRDAGTYSGISVQVLKSGYELTGSGNASGTLTIAPRALSVVASEASKTAGQADPALQWQAMGLGLAAGDQLSGALARDSGEAVGRYAIHLGSLANPNYNISFIGSELQIVAAAPAPAPAPAPTPPAPTPPTAPPVAGPAEPTPTPAPAPGSGAAITSAQQAAASSLAAAGRVAGAGGSPVAAAAGGPGGSAGLRLVAVAGEGSSADNTAGQRGQAGPDPLGFMRVFVVNGGLRLP